MSAIIIGVDPGKQGAIAAIDTDGILRLVKHDGRAEAALIAYWWLHFGERAR